MSIEKKTTVDKIFISNLNISNYYDMCAVSGYIYESSELGSIFIPWTKEKLDLFHIKIHRQNAPELQISPLQNSTDNGAYRFNCFFSMPNDKTDNTARLAFLYDDMIIKHISLSNIDIPFKVNETYTVKNYWINFKSNYIEITKFTPRPEYLISCIIPVFNGEKYLEEAVGSVIGQSIDFFENVQLILVNDGSTDNTEKICAEYKNRYPYNVTYIDSSACGENRGVSAARNAGLRYAVGEYISFLDSDDLLNSDYYRTAVYYLSANKENADDSIDLAAFPIKCFDSQGNTYPTVLNFRFDDTRIIDVFNEPDFIQFGVHSAVFRKNVLFDVQFDEKLHYSEDAEFIHRVLMKKSRYFLINGPAYNYRRRDKEESIFQVNADLLSSTQKYLESPSWYEKFDIFGKTLIHSSIAAHGYVTEYTQSLIVHDLMSGAVKKIPDSIKNTVNINNIFNTISCLLHEVSDSVIISYRHLNKWLKYYFLKLKHGGESIKENGGRPAFYTGGYLFENLDAIITIRNIREISGYMRITGSYDLPQYDSFKLIGEINGKNIIDAIEKDYPSEDIYYLSEIIHKTKAFILCIPIPANSNASIKLSLYLSHKNNKYPAKIAFTDSASCMERDYDGIMVRKTFVIIKTNCENEFIIEKISTSKLAETLETKIKNNPNKLTKNINKIAKQYNIILPLMNKKIWMFADSGNKAGGSAEALFRYCANIEDDIYKVFVIDKDTMDSYNLKEEYDALRQDMPSNANIKIVDSGSDQHKLLYLFADKLIVSDINDIMYNIFDDIEVETIFNNLLHHSIVFLDDRKSSIGEFADIPVNKKILNNIELWAVSTDAKKQSIIDKYDDIDFDKSAIKITGTPRFDYLIDHREKKILVMPDYCRSLFISEIIYNTKFKKSKYCTAIHEMLCDINLLDGLYELGYELCFAPHDKTYIQLADFDVNSEVTIISPTYPREKLFNQCALLITDNMLTEEYIYMKKPVLFYDFGNNNDEANNDYDAKQSIFGETARSHGEIVDMILKYAKESCIMPPNFHEQVDKYFAYTDRGNCARVYEALKRSYLEENVIDHRSTG